jgi:hypothetical protein
LRDFQCFYSFSASLQAQPCEELYKYVMWRGRHCRIKRQKYAYHSSGTAIFY